MDISKVQFDERGLIPAVVQDVTTREVLMLAYMNKESLELTGKTGFTHFWSRSRQELWKKGDTSGHLQKVHEMHYDCDGDTILVKVTQTGVACHTGAKSCFYTLLQKTEGEDQKKTLSSIMDEVFEVILERKKSNLADSYVCSLFQKGQDQILKKVGEEAAEVIIGSKNKNTEEIVWEIADLWFHTLVLLGFHEIPPTEIYNELHKRFGKKGKK